MTAFFTTYLNVSDPAGYCPHCLNQGLVVLDREQPLCQRVAGMGCVGRHDCGSCVVAAACPMCERGARFDLQGAGGDWWSESDAMLHSWNGGLTFRHTVCGGCKERIVLDGSHRCAARVSA